MSNPGTLIRVVGIVTKLSSQTSHVLEKDLSVAREWAAVRKKSKEDDSKWSHDTERFKFILNVRQRY